MTKKQKKFLIKWTAIMGIICGIITGMLLLITGQNTVTEYGFWFQVIVMAMGGGILLGLIPSVLVEYRRSSKE